MRPVKPFTHLIKVARLVTRALKVLAVGAFACLALLIGTSVASAAERPVEPVGQTATAVTPAGVTAVGSGLAQGCPVSTDSMRWG